MNILTELKNEKRFVYWKPQEKLTQKGTKYLTKIPINPFNNKPASVLDSETWGKLSDLNLKTTKYSGIGFVLGNGFVGVDIDDCFLNEKGTEIANELVNALDSYSEYSPSKKGIHIFLKCPDFEKLISRRINKLYLRVEFYHDTRYFTLSRNVYLKYRPIKTINALELATILKKYFNCELLKENCGKVFTIINKSNTSSLSCELTPGDKRIIKHLTNNPNPSTQEYFKKMYYDGKCATKKTASENDFYLCVLFSNYTRNPKQLLRLFKSSKSYRADKWNRKDSTFKTLGERLINAVLVSRAKRENKELKL